MILIARFRRSGKSYLSKMKLLLDTQVWLWWFASPENISHSAMDAIEDPKNELYFSSASSLEIAIKVRLKKLTLPEDPGTYVLSRLAVGKVNGLSVTHEHALGVASLPPIHEDPFDRLIVAQALCEKMRLVTADKVLVKYPISFLKA